MSHLLQNPDIVTVIHIEVVAKRPFQSLKINENVRVLELCLLGRASSPVDLVHVKKWLN